jgi:hypothetical protein
MARMSDKCAGTSWSDEKEAEPQHYRGLEIAACPRPACRRSKTCAVDGKWSAPCLGQIANPMPEALQGASACAPAARATHEGILEGAFSSTGFLCLLLR